MKKVCWGQALRSPLGWRNCSHRAADATGDLRTGWLSGAVVSWNGWARRWRTGSGQGADASLRSSMEGPISFPRTGSAPNQRRHEMHKRLQLSSAMPEGSVSCQFHTQACCHFRFPRHDAPPNQGTFLRRMLICGTRGRRSQASISSRTEKARGIPCGARSRTAASRRSRRTAAASRQDQAPCR